ncbi:MAG: 16S rRNA (adenine(1518)-N(6)/adenine(1519)-N(6))-dimethyltransferase RsmA [Cyanobacteria bacterium RI_101]|nr:16S rRNA (adenine(1518)-N(6)/adenine(1519)-N(6))-dimethyltransferase RsmA [Cyanobacteria bacterium RI_101]
MSVRPRKRFGQHWLQSPLALSQILGAAEITPEDKILEIGPGLGVLTQELIPRAGSVVSVELDRDLCHKLRRRFGERENFLLLEGDFLTLELETLLTGQLQCWPLNKVVANIPYNITAPILEKLLGTIAQPRTPAFERIVLLIQKEVAERLVAQPQTKAYGALSVRIQYLAHCQWIADVPRSAFKPAPKVDSAIVCLQPRPAPDGNAQRLGELVQLGFAQRRKMLRNNLKDLCPPDKLGEILAQNQLPPTARAEDLSLDQWLDLCRKLS